MKRITIWLMLAWLLATPSGCAYTLKETGHRDLDRSIRCCDRCCAVVAIGAIWAGANTAVAWLNGERETCDGRPSSWDTEDQLKPLSLEDVQNAGDSL